jgi:hypothetical protein
MVMFDALHDGLTLIAVFMSERFRRGKKLKQGRGGGAHRTTIGGLFAVVDVPADDAAPALHSKPSPIMTFSTS